MRFDLGLYRLYKTGSEEYQDFKEHEVDDAMADGWRDVPNFVAPDPPKKGARKPRKG